MEEEDDEKDVFAPGDEDEPKPLNVKGRTRRIKGKRKRARREPTKLLWTQTTEEVVLRALKMGHHLGVAVRLAGMNPNAVSRWRKFAAAGREPFKTIMDRIERAQAESEGIYLQVVARAALKDKPELALKILERRHPSRWGERVQHTVHEELTAAIERLREALSPDEFTKAMAALAREE